MAVGHSELFTAEFSAKRGDDMVTVFLFTAKFSAKRRDNSRPQWIVYRWILSQARGLHGHSIFFTAKFSAKRGDDNRSWSSSQPSEGMGVQNMAFLVRIYRWI